MKRIFPTLAVASALLLAACVDTTGISKTLSSGPNPKTNPNAAVQVVEFGDLQCPACRAAYDQIVKPMIDKYGMKIRLDFMHFPLRSIHQYALDAAEASECAADQGKFWQFMDMDYEHQEDLNDQALAQWAQTLNLNMDLFTRCTTSHIKKAGIMEEYAKGQAKGVSGTPTFFVNGQQVDVMNLGSAIDAILASMKKTL
jgi:protein-disulfide isomerase